jgi:hypothetical protein
MTTPVVRLADGPGTPVLVVDFAQFDSATTVSAGLAGRANRSVYRIDPVDVQTCCVEDLVECCVPAIAALAPAVIVAYCSAAALGLRLVHALAVRGHPAPETVLVEPTWVTPAHIAADLANVRTSLGAADPCSVADPTDLAAVLHAVRTDLRASFLHSGLATRRAEDEAELIVELLLPRYQAWFSYLIGVERAALPPPGRAVTVLVSRDTGRGAEWAHRLPNCHVRTLPVDHAALLGSAALEAALEAALDAVAVAR